MEPIATVSDNLRYEYKVTLSPNYLPDVFSLVRQHRAMFRKEYPDRIVNNVYFDSPDLACYHAHVLGAAHRQKFRIRWYGTPSETIQSPMLEQKIKRGFVGEKIFTPLPPLSLNGGGPWDIPQAATSRACHAEDTLHWKLKTLVPVVAIRYERQYFVSADHLFRITIDRNIEYFTLLTVTRHHRPAWSTPLVLEFKYARENDPIAMEITNAIPIRLNRFSKYIYAVDSLRAM